MQTMSLSSPNPATRLATCQVRTYGPQPIAGHGQGAMITATVSFDDRCGNNRNTLSIMAEVTIPTVRGRRAIVASGALHEDVAIALPALATIVKWDLVSTSGPLHYIENTLYWLGRRSYCDGRQGSPPNLDHARKTACWPDLPECFLTDPGVSSATIERVLVERLPALLIEFRAAIESLGMVW